MENKQMILVTGASGHLGSAVIRSLLKKIAPDQIAAFVRDESKAADLKATGVSVRRGDYSDVQSLDQAMKGIDKVLLIAGTDEEKRLIQHTNVINAAKRAGVSCLAYTSRNLRDRSTLVNKLMVGHFQTEDYLKTSGLNYIIFRNALYLDTIPQFAGEKAFETGIKLPTGEGKVAFALRREMGEAIANALLKTDAAQHRVYELTGGQSYSFGGVAAALSKLSAAQIDYEPVEVPVFEAQLKERGLSEMMIQRITNFLTDIKNDQEAKVSSDLANLLNRNPISLKEGLKIIFKIQTM